MNKMFTILNYRHDPARLLLTFGAAVNKSDKFQQNTPLHWACTTGNNVVAKLLLDKGAELDALNAKVSTEIYVLDITCI
jgi:ankyrin repeat protein